MADYIAVIQAILASAAGAGGYALLAWWKSGEHFKSTKFLSTILLAVVLGGIGGAIGLSDILEVEAYLGQYGLYPILTILVELAAKAISRRLGWT